MFFDHWLDCSICGERHNCTCTDQQREDYERKIKRVKDAARIKRGDFKRLLAKVRGDDQVIMVDSVIEQSYDNLPRLGPDWTDRLEQTKDTHPLMDLVFDEAKKAIVIPVQREVIQAQITETKTEDLKDAFPTVLSNEQKHYMILALGFKDHGKNVWLNPELGEGRWFHLDLSTDNIDELVHRLLIHETFKLS